jgi:uncharacterized membrane protein
VKLRLAVILIALAGCKSAPDPVVASPSVEPFKQVEKAQEKADGRVAGALVAIERNADKPPVVRAEAKLAQEYLPKPSEDDVNFALARAARADEKTYSEQSAFAKKFLAKLELDWKAVDDQAKVNADKMEKANKQIAFLEGEVKRVEEEGTRNVYKLILGGCAGICLIAALVMGLTGQYVRAGAALALGACIGALPMLYENVYFMPIFIGFISILLCLVLWFAWDQIRDKINESSSAK